MLLPGEVFAREFLASFTLGCSPLFQNIKANMFFVSVNETESCASEGKTRISNRIAVCQAAPIYPCVQLSLAEQFDGSLYG